MADILKGLCHGFLASLWTAKRYIYIYIYTPNSKKVALGIGSWALGSYCLAVTQAKHFIVFVCPNRSELRGTSISNTNPMSQPLRVSFYF